MKGTLVRYCDDFVILIASREEAELGLELVKTKMAELHLELNAKKTKIVDMRCGKEGIDFLGFHHRQVMSHRHKRRYALKWPKKAAVNKIKQEIREKLGTRVILKLSLEEVVKLLNPTLRGWVNYFKFGNSSKVFNQIDSYVHERLAIWWSKKHLMGGRRWKTDFTWKKHRESGVLVMNGNVQYWSTL